MKRLPLVLCAVLAWCSVVLSPTAAGAQERAQRRVYPKSDVRRTYTKSDVQRIVNQVEDRSDIFRKAIDRQLDHSRLNGSRQEDRINDQVKQYDRTVDELRREFSRRDSWMETRGNVERVLRQANDVDRIMHGANLGRGVESEWSTLRRDLNTLAGVYNLKPLR